MLRFVRTHAHHTHTPYEIQRRMPGLNGIYWYRHRIFFNFSFSPLFCLLPVKVAKKLHLHRQAARNRFRSKYLVNYITNKTVLTKGIEIKMANRETILLIKFTRKQCIYARHYHFHWSTEWNGCYDCRFIMGSWQTLAWNDNLIINAIIFNE